MHDQAVRLAGSLIGVEPELEQEFEVRLVESSTLAFRVAFSVLRHRQDAEDIAQEAFVKAYRGFRQLRDRDRFRASLDVDPSPEFLARVRTGIASEPRQAAWRWPWMFAAAGAMATLIAIAIVVSGPHEVSSVLPADRTPLQARTVAPFSQIVPVASGFSRTERSAEAFALRPAAHQPPEPEILIDPRESMALRRLIAGTREGTLDLSAALQATTPTAMDLP